VMRFTKERQPETPIVMITAHGSEKIAVDAMKLGAEDYVPKPFDNDEIRLVVRRALERTQLARENRLLRARVEREFGMGNLIGRGAAMRAVFETIRKVAETDLTVLIRGESGTGKELVAQALHEASPRKSGPFVAVNCAAISRELVESELFGHEKGAFTGADARRVGRFEAAHGGTIFLDEIGDMAPDTQAKVLRVRDNGPGMDAERLGRIWSPFYTSKATGTGLGLALCRKVIEAHGGAIEASSTPGSGTEFLITLPRANAAAEAR